MSNIVKTIAGLTMACAVGLVEAVSHGGLGGFSRVGRAVEEFEAVRPSLDTSSPVATSSAILNGVSRGFQAANANQSAPAPSATPQVADLASADTVEEAAKFFPGSVTIGHRWLVARVQTQATTGPISACMAMVKDGQHALIMYSAHSLPFSMLIGERSTVGNVGPESAFRVSIEGLPTEKFKWNEFYKEGALTGRVFVTEQRRPPIVQRLQMGKSMIVQVDRNSWAIDLAGSGQAIAALYDCAQRDDQ